SASVDLSTIEDIAVCLGQKTDQDGNKFLMRQENIAEIRDNLRESVPALSINKRDPKMGPLEAMIVSWVCLTGDDGTLPTGSVKAESAFAQGKISSPPGNGKLATKFWDFLLFAYAVGVNNNGKNGKCGGSGGVSAPPPVINKYYYNEDDLIRVADYLVPAIQVVDSGMRNGTYMAHLPTNPGSYSAKLDISKLADLQVPWADLQNVLRKGDLIFMKGEPGLIDVPQKIIADFSHWTHVALVYNARSSDRTVFESMLENGTGIYSRAKGWKGKQIQLAITRIQDLSESQIGSRVESSLSAYNKKPYLPQNVEAPSAKPSLVDILANYFKKWCDKDDLSSMYCSKLVWWTFYPAINLDSNSTRLPAKYYALNTAVIQEKDKTDRGVWVDNAWIGVSPDDIYLSKHLYSNDIYYKSSI
ncbi:MAG: hypothetical protein WC838_06465, partial [Candidatus Margulisiibacteriota bacterium]